MFLKTIPLHQRLMRFKYLYMVFLINGCTYFNSTNAEIQSVTLQWIPFQYDIPACTESCGEQIIKQLEKINSVESVQVDLGGGKVNLLWRRGIPFSYPAVDAAMRLAGPGINEIHIKARGAIIHNRDSVTLISKDDGTRFILLGPLFARPNQYVVEFNTASYPLPPETREQLINAENNRQYVTISGKLLLPEQSPPLYLIIANMQIGQPENE